jgi:hypothetical protein
VVVDDFDVKGVIVSPSKADPPLLIDPNTVLPAPIALELLEPLTRRHLQIAKTLGGVEHSKLPSRCSLNFGR